MIKDSNDTCVPVKEARMLDSGLSLESGFLIRQEDLFLIIVIVRQHMNGWRMRMFKESDLRDDEGVRVEVENRNGEALMAQNMKAECAW
jgi:hypothetical protein